MKFKKLNFSVDEELHKALKVRALNEGKPLYEFLPELLKKEIRNEQLF